MSSLILSEFVSLDGVMEAPSEEPGNPRSGWVADRMSEAQLRFKLDECLEAGSLLIGRRTYEIFADAWPSRDGEFADKMNTMPKYVISTTLTGPAWNNTMVLCGDLHDAVRVRKAQDDAPILCVGSRSVAQGLMKHDLIDDYRVMVFPVVLGGGARLFPDALEPRRLDLTDTQIFDSGVVVHTYRRA
ncbi:MAG: dihydrofolate reductase family protein [Acidimicrobiales bacterium]